MLRPLPITSASLTFVDDSLHLTASSKKTHNTFATRPLRHKPIALWVSSDPSLNQDRPLVPCRPFAACLTISKYASIVSFIVLEVSMLLIVVIESWLEIMDQLCFSLFYPVIYAVGLVQNIFWYTNKFYIPVPTG